MTDRLALGIEDAHAVELGIAHAPAAPQITVDIDAEAVGRAARAGIDQDLAVGDLHAVVDHVIDHDRAVWLGARRPRRRASFRRGEKASPLGAGHVVDHHGELAGVWIEAIDGGRVLTLGLVTFVVGEDAEGRIGEPDRMVGLHHDIVRRIERLAVVGLGQHRDRAVILGAHGRGAHRARSPPIGLGGRACGRLALFDGFAEDRDDAGFLVPAQDAVVRDVAP